MSGYKICFFKFRVGGITESQTLEIISIFLDEPAKDWFAENSTTFEAWGTFKAECLHTYSLPATKQLRVRVRVSRALQANTLTLHILTHPSSQFLTVSQLYELLIINLASTCLLACVWTLNKTKIANSYIFENV
jgi:hypothetical protein